MTEKNTLAATIENTFISLLANLHTCLPGRIESYDWKTQKATVKPLIKKRFLDGETLVLPVLTNVPIVFPRAREAGVTFPLSKGDGVLIVFSERSLERWKSSGEDVEPGDPRRFDLSDAIAIPGLFSFNEKNIASGSEDVEIQNKRGKIAIGSKTTQAIDGVLTGKTIDPFTGTPFSALPGPGTTGKNISLKVRAEF